MSEDEAAKLRVLLANEDEQELERLAVEIEALGHEVIAFAIGVDEAAAVIAEQDPGLALVAVDESSEHALDLIEEISEYATGPVVAVILEDHPGFVQKAAERGIYAYAHSLDRDVLRNSIEIACRRRAEAEALEKRVDELEGALERRALIERAKGILMERHGITERESFELLRSHARSHNRRVAELAASVIEGHVLLPKRP